MFKQTIYLLLLLVATGTHAQQLNSIVPIPVKTEQLSEQPVKLVTNAVIVFDDLFTQQAAYLQQQLQQQCGLQTTAKNSKAVKTKASILLQFNTAAVTKDEMYILEVQNQQIIIKAKSVRGIINGIQTLLQLLPLQHSNTIEVAACRITDYPRFTYRGMHLDVVRHIFPVSYIKKYIDYLTFHKFNTFHWHLTDDQGWRIEMLSYPKLNSVGSWRDSTLIGHFKDAPARYERNRYGGYYTRAEVKEIIAYAQVRGITIIPEIDIPGHSRATITAYPELSTDPNNKWGVAATWGMYNRVNNVLAPTPATFEFLRKVFHEIADLFPSPYIHVGGDECSKMWWKQLSLIHI